jgi:hypothetical protein
MEEQAEILEKHLQIILQKRLLEKVSTLSVDKEYIEIIIKEIINNGTFIINVKEELNTKIVIEKEKDLLELKALVMDYSLPKCNDCDDSLCDCKYSSVFSSIFEENKIIECIKALHNLFNSDGSLTYSKLTDRFYPSSDISIMKKIEKITKAKIFISKQQDTYTCCICSDLNTVFTQCHHNLCRYCFSKLYNNTIFSDNPVLCPICRQKIHD